MIIDGSLVKDYVSAASGIGQNYCESSTIDSDLG